MSKNFHDITVDQLCTVIDMLNPCIDDYLYVYDLINDFYYISPHALERFTLPGNTFDDVVFNHSKFVFPPDLPELQADLQALISGEKDFHNLQYRWMDLDRQPVWINCRGFIIRDEANTPLYMIGCVNEIGTKQKADNVSGLLGQTSLQTYLYDYHSFFPDGYMLRLGLDDFKDINENFGMEYGDKIIRRTAQCISECIKPGQMLYKIVADEFFVVDFLNGTADDAAELYHKIRQSLGQFVDDNEYQTVVTISGGVLECSKIEDHSFSNIMKLSEFALNEAKRKGKNRHYVYKEEDYQKLLRKKEMTQIIRQAVKNDFDGFEAYFQPLFSFDTDTLYGAETLMRFHTEKYGMVSPVEFVPILEETGLIIPTGRWIMQQALEACKKIQYILPNFHISINVSYIQVMKGDLINELIDAVSSLEIPPSSVIVELTDSGAMPTDSRFSKLWALLKETGILIALDNFGTGYSNFHSLYDLRPDIIKIDHFFTAKALQNDYDFTLLSLMTQLAHNLDLKICVEGIENEKSRQELIPLLPDYCQGFLSGRPCSYEDFIEQFINVTR